VFGYEDTLLSEILVVRDSISSIVGLFLILRKGPKPGRNY